MEPRPETPSPHRPTQFAAPSAARQAFGYPISKSPDTLIRGGRKHPAGRTGPTAASPRGHGIKGRLRAIASACWIAAAVTLGTAEARANPLPQPIEQALSRSGIGLGNVAIWVQPVDAAAPTLVHNADKPMNPASVMKLVTAFAAFGILGPAHTWTTRVMTNGTLREGVLDGDLYIVGGADPVLSYERVWKLLRQLRAIGITVVRGDLILDGSALALPDHDPSAFDGRGLRPYNSGPHGLLLHFNTLLLNLQPARTAGAPVGVVSSPPIAGLRIDNRIVTETGACGVWHRNLDARLEATPAGTSLILLGGLPASCGERTWSAAPLPPQAFATAVVAALWEEVGGQLTGSVRSGIAPAGAEAITSDASPALAEVVREMNKWSSNVIARQLLASIGRRSPASPHMVAAGANLTLAHLQQAGIDTHGLVIENGAGLSRIERIRADSLGAMLLAAWQRPFMPEFIAALPLAGIDGTAHRRLSGSPARGQAHIKTGTINQVRAIGGYVLDRNGRRHAVVMMVNDARAHESQTAQDALLEWVWSGATGNGR